MAVGPPPLLLTPRQREAVARLERFIDEHLVGSEIFARGLSNGNVEVILPEALDPEVAEELSRLYREAGWARVLVGARGGWHIRLEALP